ncbi:MAG TPA: hypothetical protein VGA38_04270 [Candidatus Limnocylindria bacterium]
MTARTELNTLEASGLVQVATLEPELEYLFRHALVQDAAYSSLLKQDRRMLHRLAAQTLVALYPERRHELAAVIAMHFEQAGDPAAAAEHFVIAGEQALERFANREGVVFFDHAEASLGPDDQRIDLRLRAALGGAKVSWTFRGPAEAIGRLERASDVGEAHGDRRLLADIYFWIAFLRRSRGEVVTTSAELKRAVDRAAAIGAELGDPTAQAIPTAYMAVGMIFSGQLKEGTALLGPALETIATKADPVSASILAGLLTLGNARRGEFAAAERSLELAARLARNGDPIATLDADIARSGLLVERGDIAAGELLATTCAARSEELGVIACAAPANMITGIAHLARDDVEGARAPLERGDEVAHLIGMLGFQTVVEGLLGSVQARLGDLPRGNATWAVALERAGSMHDRYGEAVTRWQRAIALARATPPDHTTALADLDSATALFDEMGARPSLARTLRERARVLGALGRSADAGADERRSRAIAADLGLKDFAP